MYTRKLVNQVLKGLLNGESLRKIGNDVGLHHEKVRLIGLEHGIYSQASFQMNQPEDIKRAQRRIKKNFWQVKQALDLPWRKAVQF